MPMKISQKHSSLLDSDQTRPSGKIIQNLPDSDGEFDADVEIDEYHN